MATLPEDVSDDLRLVIDELESAIADIESRLESTRAERDEAKARQVELTIENARLFKENKEALERQVATAEVLGVINSSPGELTRVFDAILEKATLLCGAGFSALAIYDGDDMHQVVALRGCPPGLADMLRVPVRLGPETGLGRLVRGEHFVHIADASDDEGYRLGNPVRRALVDLAGARSYLAVPIRGDGAMLGSFTIYRQEVRPFSTELIALLQSFAAQAAIAIENVRLFNETQEALERQTATADILKVIASSPDDVQPVFDAIATSSKQLIGAFSATVFRFVDGFVNLAAYTPINPAADEVLIASFPRPAAGLPFFELAKGGEVVQEADSETNPDAGMRAIARARGFRSSLFSPLMNKGTPIGLIVVTRKEPGAFADHHVQLVQTFADQAVIAIENARLFNETREALERQTATGEILKVIASSPTDVQPVFDAIAASANRLIGGFSSTVMLFVRDVLQLVAFTPTTPTADEMLQASFPRPLAEFPPFELVRDGETVQFPDTESEDVPPLNRELARSRGYRGMLFTPLMSKGTAIGILSVTRKEPGAFAGDHLQLLRTFADQAVIAIENVRLFNETQEALERQTATADILKVIASSPDDVQPVFEAIAERSNRLIDGLSTAVYSIVDDTMHLMAFTRSSPEADAALRAAFPRPLSDANWGEQIRHGEIVQVADMELTAEWEVPAFRKMAQLRGFRAVLFVPLLRDGTTIGLISVTRREPGAFTTHHVQLLQTFADQAVIAIGNVRLFDEVQAKTRDLTEALTYQTGSSNILKVIASSPTDVGPVLKAIAESACELCGADDAVVFLEDTGELHSVAHFGPMPEGLIRLPIGRTRIVGRAFLDRKPTHVRDFHSPEGAEFPDGQEIARQLGHRTMLAVPLLREEESIGVILLRRNEVRPFDDKQIALLQTFADQAVIAIGNVRLFDEVQAKTRDLTESLEQQTATSEVLEVISSSPGELEPVFQKMLENATRICGAHFGTMSLHDAGMFRHVALYNVPDAFAEQIQAPIRPHPKSGLATIATTRQAIQIEDLRTQPPYLEGDPTVVAMSDLAGARTLVVVPMLRENELIGAIAIYRQEVRTFSDKQVELVANFAKQAVIAIENTRLLRELRQRTDDLSESLEQQTATSEVLQVISSSPGELQPVFKSMLTNALRICDAKFGNLLLFNGEGFTLAEMHNAPAAYGELYKDGPLRPGPHTGLGRLMATKEVIHIADVQAASDAEGDPLRVATTQILQARSFLAVPMLKDKELVGAIVIYRQEVRPFSTKEIELVSSFASQAVIAIENTRLLRELRERTDDLTESLQQQTATADVLKVISRSAFDLQSVLDTLVTSASRLCSADQGMLLLFEGGVLMPLSYFGPYPDKFEFRKSLAAAPHRGNLSGRAVLDGQTAHVADVLADPEFTNNSWQELTGFRAMLAVPLLRQGQPIGAMALSRTTPGLFADRQIELVSTFADQAVIAIENVRLFDEVQAKTRDLTEALTYQTGSSNILSVIASSPTDVTPVLNAIVESASKLCEAYDAVVLLKDGDDLRFSAHHGPIPINIEKWPINRNWASGRAFLDQEPVHVRDLLSDEGAEFPGGRELSRHAGIGVRTLLSVPLLRENESVGAILLRRTELHPFSDKQIALLQTFADQAVIAIGNVRLFDEVQAKTRDLTEALTYQTGSSNILKVIASSPTDVGPVLKAIVESACELCGAYDALVRLKDGDGLAFGAHHGSLPVSLASVPITENSTGGLAVIERKPVHVHDLLSPEGDRFPHARELARMHGERTILSVPLLRESESVGVIIIRRREVDPFTDKQIALLQTFADQAVIAIGNVRLFDEVQAKTRDLTEALTYQTGSSNILKVIASSPTDVKPVLKAIVESACELCEADDALATLRDGDELVFQAQHGSIPVVWDRQPIDREGAAGLAVIERAPVHVHDLLAPEGEQFPRAREFARKTNVRTVLCVPLLREGESIGVIVLRRTEVRPFGDKQITLLQTFADQAVIAIGNVRLFDEVQARTRDLTESLQQQTATADVLKVISRSAFDLQPVLDTLLQSAVRLADADKGTITRQRDNLFYREITHGFPPEFAEYARTVPVAPDRATASGRALLEGKVVHIEDAQADPDFTWGGGPAGVWRLENPAKLGGFRTVLGVPLLREGIPIGVIGLSRSEVRPFTDKQIELVTTFADQAVIAIENVRLFDEVQTRTKELAASLDELRTAQDRLVQTEKLASLGQLTAGIAHEIKNPLNFVNNFSALSAELTDELNTLLKSAVLTDKLREEVDELTGMLKDNLEKVVQHGKRADSIVKNMLLHSREGSGEHRPADINALLDESLNLAYHGARAEKPQFNVTLQRDFDQQAGMIEVFPQEITRVFLNLISNGFYAVTKRRAENGNSGFEPLLVASTRNLGETVEIRIRDNGTGIPEAVREKMFNPFFTTKPAGEGTGLGLSMSHDIIVKQHGGRIDVATEPGQFTEFTIVLPRTSNQSNKAGGQS